eukprot:scaffold21861_cov31-Prasinocladus_malaysianus.AAC.1
MQSWHHAKHCVSLVLTPSVSPCNQSTKQELNDLTEKTYKILVDDITCLLYLPLAAFASAKFGHDAVEWAASPWGPNTGQPPRGPDALISTLLGRM